MKQAYVQLARTLAYIDINELAPKGNVMFSSIARGLAERYSFQKSPSALEDFDLSKGIDFIAGMSGEIPIHRLAIFDSLILVETRTNTNDAQGIIGEMLIWASETFGLTVADGMIKQWGYVSNVVFFSDTRLLDVHPAVRNLTARVTELVSNVKGEDIEYLPIRLAVGHDPDTRKWPIAAFTIERKGEARFSENKFFSEAPLPTHQHWKVLEAFEQEVLNESIVQTHGSGKIER